MIQQISIVSVVHTILTPHYLQLMTGNKDFNEIVHQLGFQEVTRQVSNSKNALFALPRQKKDTKASMTWSATCQWVACSPKDRF